MYDGNETLSRLTALEAHWNVSYMKQVYSIYQVFVLFYVLVVRPVLISFTIISPTEVLYAPPYYL